MSAAGYSALAETDIYIGYGTAEYPLIPASEDAVFYCAFLLTFRGGRI